MYFPTNCSENGPYGHFGPIWQGFGRGGIQKVTVYAGGQKCWLIDQIIQEDLPTYHDSEDCKEGGYDGFHVDAQECGIIILKNEENQNRQAGEEQFGDHKMPNAQVHKPGHKGIFLGCPLLEQVKREQTV